LGDSSTDVRVIDTMLNRRLAGRAASLVQEKTEKPIRHVVNTNHHGGRSY